jgi:uncharacterized protein (TIGR03437 family)
MPFRVLARSLLAVLFAVSGKAQFEIRGSRLFLEGRPFAVRGVAYSPTPIGQAAGPVLDVSACVYHRDFPLAVRAGINTIRLYARLPSDDAGFWQAVERANLYVLAGFPLEPYYHPAATLSPQSESGRMLRASILRDFASYAEQLRGRQRVIALVFGNEVAADYGRKFSGQARDFYTLLEEAGAALRTAGGALLTTAVAETAELDKAEAPGLFWSVNASRGTSFGGLFEEARLRTGRPLLLSEFGVDAWDSRTQAEASEVQAEALRRLAEELQREVDRPDSRVLGGVWFGWTDEWWRGASDPSRHGAEGVPASGFPDGVRNPGWFGLFGVTTTGLPGLDALRARPAFTALAEAWGGKLPEPWPAIPPPRLEPLGVVNAGSLAPHVARGGLVSFFGEYLTVEPSGSELTSACLAGRPAPLLFASTTQLNGQVPWESATGPADALVFRAGTASNPLRVEVREVSPGILERGVLEAGKPCPVTVTNGVRPGAYLEIYGTGLGAAGAPPPTGFAPAEASPTNVPPRAMLGARELRVLYSGLVPGILGLYQTNVQVPPDFPVAATAGLRLLSGTSGSNALPIAIHGAGEVAGVSLRPQTLSFEIQAGGPPQSKELAIEGVNGFCEVVRFAVSGVPEGVRVTAPVGFPGYRVPITVEALPSAPALESIDVILAAQTRAEHNPAARLRVAVLPGRGDISFRVVSGGGRAGFVAQFEMAGRIIHQAHGGGPGRGFHFIVLNGATGVLGPVRSFDTWASEPAAEAMASYLAALPLGTVVLGAIADEGTLNLTPRAREALRTVLRSQFADALQYQDSWAVIGRTGAIAPIAEGWSADRQVVLQKVLTFPLP